MAFFRKKFFNNLLLSEEGDGDIYIRNISIIIITHSIDDEVP